MLRKVLVVLLIVFILIGQMAVVPAFGAIPPEKPLNASSVPAGIWAGVWEVSGSWRTMTLAQDGNIVSGSYTWEEGSINGTVSGNTWAGRWSQVGNSRSGGFKAVMAYDLMTFGMTWWYDEQMGLGDSIYTGDIGVRVHHEVGPPIVFEPGGLPPRSSFDVYLCIGQSNMAGDDALFEKQDQFVIPNTLLFNGGKWETAQPGYYNSMLTWGLNRYNNVDTDFVGNGSFLSPAFYFAYIMQAYTPGRTIGIISNARSGSSIDEWGKGAFCYNQTVLMAKAALEQGGTLRGILWHQGEADLWLNILPPYLSKLNKLADDLRNEFGVLPEQCPFIAGEIGYTFGAGLGFLPPSEFNRLLPGFVSAARNTDYISAALDPLFPEDGGLPMANEYHFTTAAQRVLGMRYADKMLEMQRGGDIPSGVKVSGKIKSYNPKNPITIRLLKNGEVAYTATIQSGAGYGQVEQSFTIPGVAPGTYSLVITKSAHTKFTVQTVVVGGADVDLTQDGRPEV
ncbi:MAG: hypothetical protein LBH28_11100, partial [Oscillospiraceae bacterium]|nr:hypothetical protein [Oscillospiraceae bacterium]